MTVTKSTCMEDEEGRFRKAKGSSCMRHDGSSTESVNPAVGTSVLETAGEEPGSADGEYAATEVD